MPVEEQVVSVFAGVRGHLDGIAVADIGRFEVALLAAMRGPHAAVLESIRTEREISEDTEQKLSNILDDLVKSFA